MGDLAAQFPGQGSQHVGMGRELAVSSSIARELFQRADDVLGHSLSTICWEGPEDVLRQTEHAQPAILIHAFAAWSVAREEAAERVRFAAGHSLGEFTAYAAAGSIAFDDAVRLVRRRGELMAEAREGTMSAIVGLDAASIEEVCELASGADGVVVAANYNSPQQIVISGDAEAVDRAGELAKQEGAKMVKRLSVSGAFHSPLMAEAEAGLRDALESVEFKAPAFPIVANATARPITDAEEARATLLRQLTAPVRWTDSIQLIAGSGIHEFIEFGPGKVLTGLLRRIDRKLQGIEIGTSEDVERLAKAGFDAGT